MTDEDEKRFVEEEVRVTSAEYFRTPTGKNVTRKVIGDSGEKDEK
jgi:hypothetical protein